MHFKFKLDQYGKMKALDPRNKQALRKYLYYQNKCKIWSIKLDDIDSINRIAMQEKLETAQMQNQPKTSYKAQMQLRQDDL